MKIPAQFNKFISVFFMAMVAAMFSGCQIEEANGISFEQGDTQTNNPPVSGSNPTPTPSPSPAPSTPPSSNTGTALLKWNAPTQYTNNKSIVVLSGYNIYYGTDQNNLSNKIWISNPYTLNHQFDTLTTNQTYYFSVAAVTDGNTEGVRSTIVSKQIL